MAKTKKHRKEVSESEESSESTSSSSSSSETSSEESSSSGEEKSHKKRKMRKEKTTKSKKPKRKSSSSSSNSSSSDSGDESSSSSTSEDKAAKKEKLFKKRKNRKNSPENKKLRENGSDAHSEERLTRFENNENIKKETSDLHNRSKWDSPGHDTATDENRRDRPRERNWNREYNNNNFRRYRRQEDNRGDKYSSRRNEYRERSDYENERRRDRDREYENNRNRYRDQNYQNRGNNFNRGNNVWDNRNRKDNRENRIQKNYRDNRNQRNERENRRSRSRSPRRHRNFPRRSSNEEQKSYEWGKKEEDKKPMNLPEEKDKPNFALSGKLTEDTNKVYGVVIKYAEPPEARKPKRRWRLYPFKGEKVLPTLYIHRQSCYLIGRDRKVCDLPVDHPSCSKQHAALQYRLVPFEREDGTVGKRVRPYLIDLESANGTFINNKKIEPKKYIELLEKDVIKFGFSSREYVLLHENSKEDQLDDDITEEVHVKTEPEDN